MHDTGKRELLMLRRRRALRSQYDVASEIGISQAGYSLIENGYRNPTPDDAEKLIKMFGLPEGYFDLKVEKEAQ